MTCNFFWGSHGCDLPADEHKVHQCGLTTPSPEQLEAVAEGNLDPRVLGPCCQYDEDRPATARVRHSYGTLEDPEWGEWGPYGEGWRQ